MSLRRVVNAQKQENGKPMRVISAPGLWLDDRIDSIICQVRDPFATYVNPNSYLLPADELEFEGCMDSVVAGVAEALGLPQGLSFEEVFSRIK